MTDYQKPSEQLLEIFGPGPKNVCPMCGQNEPPRDPNRPRTQEIWVLTRSIDYEAPNQFCHAWIGKPTIEQLSEEATTLDAAALGLLTMSGKVYHPGEDATYELGRQS